MRLSILSAFILALAAGPIQAHAEDLVREVKAGILHHDTDNLWSNSSRESGVDGNAEIILSPDFALWGGNVRPAFGVSVNSASDTSKIYGAARWETTIADDFVFALGVGVAAHNGETALVSANKKALGSKVLLYFPIEAGYRLNERDTISLFFDHVSNAWQASPNEGMDTLGIRYGYRF